MLSLMEQTPERLAPPRDVKRTLNLDSQAPLNVVLGGMGGSGIVGDIVADFCRSSVRIPTTVCRSVRLPRFVDERTLFVAISYSGDTQETLEMLGQARRMNALLAIVCSGGKLLSEAENNGIPYVRVPSGMAPRVALPELLAAVTHVMWKAKVIEDAQRLLELAKASTSEVLKRVKAPVPMAQNPAKQAASALFGHLPLLIGSEEDGSVLRRFKNELNENSKMPAVLYTLPEACHNDVEGLKDLGHLSNPLPVIFRGQYQTERERKISDKLIDVLAGVGFPPPLLLEGSGNGRFEWLVSAITFGDFVSFYLAILKGVDPSKLALIPEFKTIRGQV